MRITLHTFSRGAALVLLQKQDEARGAVQAGLTVHPTFTIRRMRQMSDDPTYRAQRKRIRDAMRLAGEPEG